MYTLVSEKSVQYVAQCLASADSHCACARFCYSVSPWVTFQKFWNNNWIKICVDCYFNIFMLRRRILQRKRKSRRKLSAMCVRNLHNSKKSFKQLVTIVNGAMVQNGSVWSENILQNMWFLETRVPIKIETSFCMLCIHNNSNVRFEEP